ncbi:MAG: PAS domain S-box protein [Candidatus Helarchaeota archaeon]
MTNLEKILSESKMWFDNLINTIHDYAQFTENVINTVREPLIILDKNHYIVLANQAFYNKFQVTPEEVEKHLIYDLGNQQWAIPELKKLLEEILPKNTTIESYELEHDFKNIGKRTLVLNARQIIGPENQFGRILVAIEDITMRRVAEKAIKDSENWLAITLKSIGDAVITTDESGIIKSLNPIAEILTGWTQEEAKGQQIQKVFNIINEQTRKPVKNFVSRIIEKGLIVGLGNHTILISKDGKEIVITDSGSPIKNDNGEIIGTVLIFRDDTKRRYLEEVNRRLAAIVEHSNDAIISKTLEGIALSWNNSAEQIFGYSADEIIGKSLSILVPPQRKNEINDVLNKIKQGIRIDHFETERIRKDGKIVNISLSVSPIKDINGNIIGASTIARDITEQKFIKLELQKSEQKYREAYNRAEFYKDIFIHDMNNILHSILLSTQLSKLNLKDKNNFDEIEENLTIIESQIKRGTRLISNIRKLSKLENSEISLKYLELFEILENTIISIKNSFKYKIINIKIQSFYKKLLIFANELFEDVIENILINAIKHNKSPTIEIIIKISEIKRDNKIFLKIEFMDNGIGINDVNKEKIFQRSDFKNKIISGMGLGLSLVKKIIELYGGKIWVEDRIRGDYKKGSNFIILLPKVEKK